MINPIDILATVIPVYIMVIYTTGLFLLFLVSLFVDQRKDLFGELSTDEVMLITVLSWLWPFTAIIFMTIALIEWMFDTEICER